MMPAASSLTWQITVFDWRKGLVRASAPEGGGFDGTVTWTVVAAVLALVIAYIYRRFDKWAKQLDHEAEVLDKVIIAIDKLAEKTATKADLAELKELLSLVELGEKRFPKIPFGTIVATIEAYEKAVISEECSKKLSKILASKKSMDEALKLSREQGIWLDRIRSAVTTVQQVINRKRLR